jgi:hypothetical protein
MMEGKLEGRASLQTMLNQLWSRCNSIASLENSRRNSKEHTEFNDGREEQC